MDGVAAVERRRIGELGAIEVRSVFGSNVMHFTMIAGVDEDDAVASRNAAVIYDHVAIRRSADGIDADFEQISALPVAEPIAAMRAGANARFRLA